MEEGQRDEANAVTKEEEEEERDTSARRAVAGMKKAELSAFAVRMRVLNSKDALKVKVAELRTKVLQFLADNPQVQLPRAEDDSRTLASQSAAVEAVAPASGSDTPAPAAMRRKKAHETTQLRRRHPMPVLPSSQKRKKTG